MSGRLFRRLSCVLVCVAAPWVAEAAPALKLVSGSPVVGGSAASEVIVEVTGANGTVRFDTNGGSVTIAKFVPPSRYVLTLGLGPYTRPFPLTLFVRDRTGASPPVPIQVVQGLYPTFGTMTGSLLAGRQSDLTVVMADIQRPATVQLDSVDITRDTAFEGNLLRIRPVLQAPPAGCQSTLKVVNVSQLWRSAIVPARWPAPVVSVKQGDVFAGRPSQIVIDVENLSPGSVAFFQPETGARIIPKASVLQGTKSVALDFSLPGAAETYRGRIGVTGPCRAEHSVPVQVKVPQDVQPTITAITPGTVVEGKPISLTIAGKDFLPSMQVFTSVDGGAFAAATQPRIASNSAGTFITPPAINPRTGATVRVRVVNPGSGNTSATRDIVLTLSPAPPQPPRSPGGH